MIVNFPLLLAALLLLWFPRLWMRRGRVVLSRPRRRRENPLITEPWREREPGDPQIIFRVEFSKSSNYLDLLRAAMGSLLLSGGLGAPAAVLTESGASRSEVWLALGLGTFALLAGLLIQTIRWEKQRLSFYPPIFYVAGLSAGLCDVRGAAFAFVLIWAMSPSLPNARGFLSVYALLLIVFGRFFGGAGVQLLLVAAGLAFLPVLLSLLAKRPLTVFSRKTHRTRTRA